jgi:hypothetical protein
MKSLLLFVIAAGFVMHGFSQSEDSTAIVKLLEKESSTWRSGDSTAHAACWQIEAYSTVLVVTAEGKTFSVPADKMLHPSPGTMGKGGTSENTDYRMSIHGNTALVTHNETSASANGTFSHTFEVRILEKINGQWKLTGQIIQVL